MGAIRAAVKAVAPKPVNVLIGPATGPVPIVELQAAGVKRVSLGAALYCHVMAHLQDTATALAGGNIAPATEGIWPSKIMGMLRDAAAKTASS